MHLKSTIVFVGHNATQTGAPKSLLKIIHWFKDNTDCKIIVILNKSGVLLPEYKICSETYLWQRSGRLIKYFPLFRFFLDFFRQRYILAKVKKLSPACIFNNTGVNGYLLKQLKTMTPSSLIVSRIPELEAFMRRNATNGSVQLTLEYSDYIIAVSKAVKKNLTNTYRYSKDKISVVYGACDEKKYSKTNLLHKQLGIPKSDTIVCGCGTMDWRKGYDLFIQTANTIHKTYNRQDIKFIWIGSPVNTNSGIEYDFEIESLGLQDVFFRIGAVDRPSEYFVNSDIFFLSSREDPFPLVMLEAARQALPIICFDNSGGATEFIDDEMGRTIPMLNIEKAAQEIINLADHKELTKIKGLEAERKSNNYSAEKMCRNVYELISEIIPNNG